MSDLITSSLDKGAWPRFADFADADFSGWEPLSSVSSMPISEVIADQSPGTGSFHVNTRSSSTLVFAVPAQYIQDHDLAADLVKSLIGGWDGAKKRVPFPHPFYANHFCTDVSIQLVAPHGGDTFDPPGGLQQFQRALVACEFRTLPYTVDNGTNNWMTFTRKVAYQRTATPLSYYVFEAGTYAGSQAQVGTYVTAGIQFVDLTIYQVPHFVLFGASHFKSSIDEFAGHINESTLNDFAAETLLFEGADIGEPYSDGSVLTGDPRVYEVTIHLLYNSNGWNTSLDPAGRWNRIGTADGDVPPWPKTDLSLPIKTLETSFSP